MEQRSEACVKIQKKKYFFFWGGGGQVGGGGGVRVWGVRVDVNGKQKLLWKFKKNGGGVGSGGVGQGGWERRIEAFVKIQKKGGGGGVGSGVRVDVNREVKFL